MSKDSLTCPECGVTLNASVTCQGLYNELSYYTLSLGDPYFIHQLIVDTYGAQHYREGIKPIAITFALVGLYLVNEKNYTGKQVQNIHIALAKFNRTKEWPSFDAPKQKANITVQDVLQVSNDAKTEMIKKWSRAVWNIWKREQGKIKTQLKLYLDIS